MWNLTHVSEEINQHLSWNKAVILSTDRYHADFLSSLVDYLRTELTTGRKNVIIVTAPFDALVYYLYRTFNRQMDHCQVSYDVGYENGGDVAPPPVPPRPSTPGGSQPAGAKKGRPQLLVWRDETLLQRMSSSANQSSPVWSRCDLVVVDGLHEQAALCTQLLACWPGLWPLQKLLLIADSAAKLAGCLREWPHISVQYHRAPPAPVRYCCAPASGGCGGTANEAQTVLELVHSVHSGDLFLTGHILVVLAGRDEAEQCYELLSFPGAVCAAGGDVEMELVLLHELLPLDRLMQLITSTSSNRPHSRHRRCHAARGAEGDAAMKDVEDDEEDDSMSVRRVYLATAEVVKSVPMRDIGFVIDTGWRRVLHYNAEEECDELRHERVNMAEAEMRRGLARGWCYRLYEESELHREEDKETDHPAVLTEMDSLEWTWRLMAISQRVPLPPQLTGGPQSLARLRRMGLVTASDSSESVLTETGRFLTRLPLAPLPALLLLVAEQHGCVSDLAVLVSLLRLGLHTRLYRHSADTGTRTSSQQQDDVTGLVRLHADWLLVSAAASKQASWGRERGVCVNVMARLEAWRLVITQAASASALILDSAVLDSPPTLASTRDLVPIKHCLLAVLAHNVAQLQSRGAYRNLVSGRTLYIHPSSALFRVRPTLVLYYNVLKSTKAYMHQLVALDSVLLHDNDKGVSGNENTSKDKEAPLMAGYKEWILLLSGIMVALLVLVMYF